MNPSAPPLKVEIKGADVLVRRLQQLDERIRRRLMAQGLRFGATKMARGLRQVVPVQSPPRKNRRKTRIGRPHGPLKAAISTRLVRRAGAGLVKVQVTTLSRRADGFYAIFVEKGFKHVGGKQVAARPFMAPLAERMATGVVPEIAADLGRRIDDAIRSMGGG